MNEIKEMTLGPRLLCVAECVRNGGVLCDVGTDHAMLPIYLASQGKISRGYATDVNEGPIMTARRNVESIGLSHMIECIHTDGLCGTGELGITDISICGMGGELIARILSECDYIKNQGINLVLQPMSRVSELRKYLYDSGFDIVDEHYVLETGKFYNILVCRYVGMCIEYDEIELLLGKNYEAKKNDELFLIQRDRVLYHLKNKEKSSDIKEAEASRELYKRINEVIG